MQLNCEPHMAFGDVVTIICRMACPNHMFSLPAPAGMGRPGGRMFRYLMKVFSWMACHLFGFHKKWCLDACDPFGKCRFDLWSASLGSRSWFVFSIFDRTPKG